MSFREKDSPKRRGVFIDDLKSSSRRLVFVSAGKNLTAISTHRAPVRSAPQGPRLLVDLPMRLGSADSLRFSSRDFLVSTRPSQGIFAAVSFAY